MLQVDLTQVGLVGHCMKMLAPVSWFLGVILTAVPVSRGSESAMDTHCVLMDV